MAHGNIQTPCVGELLTLDDYLKLCKVQGPGIHLRTAAGMLRDMFDFFGHTEEMYCGAHVNRPNFFDGKTLGFGEYMFVGGSDLLAGLEMTIRGLAIPGSDHVAIILKGPPSAGKSILAEMITKGLIQFSIEEDIGAIYTHKFVLPKDLAFGKDKTSVGFGGRPDRAVLSEFQALDTNGNLDKDAITIDCEMHNSPIRMLPWQYRRELFENVFDIAAEDVQYLIPESFREDCCHNCEGILHALIAQYAKEYEGSNKERQQKALKDALKHIVVQRFAYNTAGMGIVTVPVNENLRIGEAVPITDQARYSKIAGVLDYLGVRFLGYRGSDHVTANRGILVLEEILQRMDILSGNENDFISRGKLRLGNISVLCDTVVLGTSNIEPYFAAMKNVNVNPGAKTRWNIRSVMHPIRISDAVKLYERTILHPQLLNKQKHVSPYAAWGLAFWSVTTRLEDPRLSLEDRPFIKAEEYSAKEKELVKELSIPQKAYLYDGDALHAEISRDFEQFITDRFVALLRDRSLREGEPMPTRILRSVIIDPALYAESPCLLPMDIFDSIDKFLCNPDNLTDPYLIRSAEHIQNRLKEMKEFLQETRKHTERFVRLDVERAIVSARNDEDHAVRLLIDYMAVASRVNQGNLDPLPNPIMAGTKVHPVELLKPFENVLLEGGLWAKNPDADKLREFREGIIHRFIQKQEDYREVRGKDYNATKDPLFYKQVYRDVLNAYVRGAMAEPIKRVLASRNSILDVLTRADQMFNKDSERFAAEQITTELEVAPEIVKLTASCLNAMLDLQKKNDCKDSAAYCPSCAPAFLEYVIKRNLLRHSLPSSQRK